MPINSEGMNSDYIKYFDLEEYISKIRLSTKLLEHLESTTCDFDNYMKKLASCPKEDIINWWVKSLYQELKSNQRIENVKFDMKSLADKSVFFDTLTISHKRIHELHNFVTEKEIEEGLLERTFEYRKVPVNVSRYTSDGIEEIFYRGANPEDVQRFMNAFVKVYKQGRASSIYSNPFLASSLMHLLFIRIHPYTDGNGRTARVIHNIKFTEMVNKLYGTRLKLSPLNLSGRILANKVTYVKRIDNIYFDMEHDTNDSINEWFDFILYMVDEQLYNISNKLASADLFNIEKTYVSSPDMRLSRIKKLK